MAEPATIDQPSIEVLIADDDPAIRLILRHRLEAAGFHVTEATDSQSALA
jgi:CheY-like chemotaxis protein